ncbi:unnamed protein product [Plutella xylostella]|uniref:(diamondback moth) hypothetical protein n=1 Tax=Plutella xylostella TaxID=51655 RepID=A0A8S4FPV2_PLUXY|nr:unnamed protein product [Plutella xylostella]
MKCAIILTVISVTFAASVPEPTQQRIIGGSATTISKYPFAAHFQRLSNSFVWRPHCGGSLLNNTVVLSAAHCFDAGLSASRYRVRLGSSSSISGGTLFSVASYLNHPEYNELDKDVAIVRLATPAVYSDVIKAARIPSNSFPIADDTKLTVIGWGALYVGGPAAEILQEVQVNKINQKICAERYRLLNEQRPPWFQLPDVTDNMFCSGILDVGGKDGCQGDSGGPVIIDNDIVVGITSWGEGCAEALYPGVNADVRAVSDWIVANAN